MSNPLRTEEKEVSRGYGIHRLATCSTAGILCLETWWADGVGTALKKILGDCTRDGFLNLGCAVRDGSFEARATKRGVEVETSTRETALIFYFVQLLHRLQQVGTVPAIDIMKYAARLGRRPE